MPRNRFVKLCWAEVKSRRASSSRVGRDHVRAHHGVGPVELCRGFEPVAVNLEGREKRIRREMRRERVGQAQHRGQVRPEQARAEDPERHVRAAAGHGLHGLVRRDRAEESLQFEHVLREGVGRARVAPQRPERAAVGARRAPEPEIDAPRIECVERAELLGDDERRMVRQHDAAGSDPDRTRAAGQVADHDRRRRARDPDHVVVFRHPVAVVAPAFGVAGKVERVPQRVARHGAQRDGSEVEDRESGHGPRSGACVRSEMQVA